MISRMPAMRAVSTLSWSASTVGSQSMARSKLTVNRMYDAKIR